MKGELISVGKVSGVFTIKIYKGYILGYRWYIDDWW